MARHWIVCNGCGAAVGPLDSPEQLGWATAALGWKRQDALDLCPLCPEVRRRRMVVLPLPVIEEE